MNCSMNTLRRAEQILGYGLTDTAGPRTYRAVGNTIYTDVFEGDLTLPFTTKFKKAFNGRVNGVEYFNEIILDTPCHERNRNVELDPIWGSAKLMAEIKDLTDWLEETPATDALDDAGVTSKKIEDFSISFRDASEKQADKSNAMLDGYGFYIRRPMIVEVSSEQKHNERYF